MKVFFEQVTELSEHLLFVFTKKGFDPKYFIDGDTLKCLEAWEEMIQQFEVGEKISPVIMINEHYNNHTQQQYNQYATWRQDYIKANNEKIVS